MRGYKTGFIKEAAGAVRLLFALLILVFILTAARGFMDHDTLRSITAVIAISIVSLAYKTVNFFISAIELIGKLPLIKDLNRIAGAVLGIFEGLFLVWAFMVALPMLDIPELTAHIESAVSGDLLLGLINKHNLIMFFLSRIFR